MSNTYTDVDRLNAAKYALNMYLMTKTKNNKIQMLYPGVKWIPDKRLRDFNCPESLGPKCELSTGHAKFVNKESCLSQSGDYRDQGKGKKPYLEWNENLSDFDNRKGLCILGNFPLRKWCEDPSSRRAGKEVDGVTNVPPFRYDQESGQCLMTKKYCDYMGGDFNKTSPDCKIPEGQKIGELFLSKTLIRGIKSGRMRELLSKAGGDINKVLSKGENYFKDEILENYVNVNPGNKNTKDYTLYKKLSNKKDIIALKVKNEDKFSYKEAIYENFGGNGVNLYILKNNREKSNKGGKKIGFILEEIKSVYPEYIKGEDLYIDFSKVKKDEKYVYLKRIYFIEKYPEFVSSIIKL